MIRRLPPEKRQPVIRKFIAVRDGYVTAYKLVRRAPGRASRWLTQRILDSLPREPAPVFRTYIATQHHNLLDLQRRQYFLEALDKAWSAATRGRPWVIHNDIPFRAMIDVDSKNTIDLASWFVGTVDEGEPTISSPGLLGFLKLEYLHDMPPTRTWRMRNDEQTSLARMTDEKYAEARRNLFPEAEGRPLEKRDVDRLIKAFWRRARPVVDDRNKNHAHAYEHRTHGTAKPVRLEEMRKLYDYAWKLLNDLGLMALGETWSENDMNGGDVEDTAEDMIDMMFLPKWFVRDMTARGLDREQIYETLHRDLPEGEAFNDRERLIRIAERDVHRRAASRETRPEGN